MRRATRTSARICAAPPRKRGSENARPRSPGVEAHRRPLMRSTLADRRRRSRQAVIETAQEDGQADEPLVPVGGDAEENQAVLQDGQQRDAENCAKYRADAAGQAGPAQNDRRQHIEFLADQHRRRHRLRELGLHQRGDAGDEAQIAVDQEIEANDVKAEPLRGVLVAAERIDLAPDIGAVQEQPGR